MKKPGASCRVTYSAFIEKLLKANVPPISFVVYAGLHPHRVPYPGKTLIPGIDADTIEENMALGFEPLRYETGCDLGMQNKDMFLITANDFEPRSSNTDTDRTLAVQ